MTLSILFDSLVFAGGLAFVLGNLKPGGLSSVRWVRIALSMSGVFAMAWAGLSIMESVMGIDDSSTPLPVLYRRSFGGAATGILLLLFLSGELSFRRKSQVQTPPHK